MSICAACSAAAPRRPPPRGDALTLSGGGLSADLSGVVDVMITVGVRTYPGATTRPGAAEPAPVAIVEWR